MIDVWPLGPDDEKWKRPALQNVWGSGVARKGELVDIVDLDGFAARQDGHPVGLLTYAVRHDEVEVLTLQADVPGRGIGRALMDAARTHAESIGASRLWLITTNDNIRAIDFYQRWGMDLAALLHNGAELSRRVKPSIPAVGDNGIAIRHELEFEVVLGR